MKRVSIHYVVFQRVIRKIVIPAFSPLCIDDISFNFDWLVLLLELFRLVESDSCGLSLMTFFGSQCWFLYHFVFPFHVLTLHFLPVNLNSQAKRDQDLFYKINTMPCRQFAYVSSAAGFSPTA